MRSAGDDPEGLLPEPHDRQVRPEAASRAEDGRVDHAPDGHVHLGEHRSLKRIERSRPLHVEDRERREVEDARVLAHGEVLGVDDRRPPPRIPFGVPSLDAVPLDQVRIRLVPVRALPACRLVEHRAERPLLLVHRRQPEAAVAGPLLRRVDDPVRLRERLARACPDVPPRLLVSVEAARLGRLQVHVRLAEHHPLRHRLSRRRPLPHPDRRGGPQTLDLGRLAEDRHAVGGEREQAVDGVLHADRRVSEDLGHELDGVLQLGVEVGLGERQLGRGERRRLERGDLLRVVVDRAVRVRADLEARAVLALVHEGVHVANDRVLDLGRRPREARHRSDVDHLVHHRRERDGRAGHACEERAPDTAGDDDGLRLDRPPGRAHATNAPTFDVEADGLGVRDDRETAVCDRSLAHQRSRAHRVDDTDIGRVEAADEDRRVDVRHERLDLRRRDERGGLDAPRLRGSHTTAQLLHPFLCACDLDPAAPREDPELAVLANALERELRDLLRVVDRKDEVRRMPGGAAGVRQRSLVEQDDVRPAQADEVVGEAVADDAAADDDRSGGGRDRGHDGG